MPMITKLETNFKGDDRVYEFHEPHILVCGDNASGKTAVINAITLPLLGKAQDLGARDEAKSQTLLQWLIPPHSSRAYSRLTFSDGTEASWELVRNRRPNRVKPLFEVTTPFDEAFAAMKAGRDKMLKYLISNFGEDESKYMPDCGPYASLTKDKPYWRAIIDVEEKAASDARAHKGTMNAIKKTAESLGFDITNPPPEQHRTPSQRGLVEAYLAAKAMYEQSHTVAKAAIEEMDKYVRAYRPKIESYLRTDSLVQDVGIIIEKSHVFLGRRQYHEHGTHTFPLVSGAETAMLALKLATRARGAAGTFGLAVLPDRGYDNTTKRAFVQAADFSTVTMVAQFITPPRGTINNWEIVRV